MSIADLPKLNATLNGLATVFILAGWIFILNQRKRSHIACMASALVASAAFLTSYLIYHIAKAGHVTKFNHPGWPKAVYLPLLTSHLILAIVVVPMVLMTVIPALRSRWDRHRRLGAWTMPVWLYVSVTGVLVYFMLYVWFPPVPVQ